MSTEKIAAYAAWVVAAVAMFGSLYASEIGHLVPCTLCWYQRIFMYPLVVIIAVGILKKDKILPLYVLPLSIFGALVAFYQYLLQAGVIVDFVPCTVGVSCLTKYGEWFGFITIPLLSLAAFVFISVSMIFLLMKYHTLEKYDTFTK